jgi:ATP-dependent Clp protease ATP-binding subunit ClpA
VHDFSNCVVVLTSNIGQDREDLSVDVDDPEARRIAYRQAAARALRPELLNRLDVIVFDRLTRAHAAIIATLELQKLAEHAAREIGLSLAWDPGLVDYVVARGYSPAFGARAVVHAVRTHVENPLATALLEARVAGRPTRAWRASVADGTIRFDGGGG